MNVERSSILRTAGLRVLALVLPAWFVLGCGNGGNGGDDVADAAAMHRDAGTMIGATGGQSGTGGANNSASGTGGVNAAGGNGAGGAGSGGANAGGTGGGGVMIDLASPTARTAACIEYSRAYYENWTTCTGSAGPDVRFWPAASRCPDMMFADGSTRTLEGTIECAAEWRAFPCSDRLRGLQPPCATSGTRAPGEKCISNFQCVSRGCNAVGMNCAACNTLVGVDDACDATHDCPDGYACDGAKCMMVDPSILAGVNAGDACNPQSANACDNRFYCNGEPPTCKELPRAGDDCKAAKLCEIDKSYCSQQGICVALPTAGQPCGTGLSGDAVWCAAEHVCDNEVDQPLCVANPHVDPCGDACPNGTRCLAATEGDASTWDCWRQRMPGESCTESDDLCLPGATRCEGGVCTLVEWQGLYEKICEP